MWAKLEDNAQLGWGRETWTACPADCAGLASSNRAAVLVSWDSTLGPLCACVKMTKLWAVLVSELHMTCGKKYQSSPHICTSLSMRQHQHRQQPDTWQRLRQKCIPTSCSTISTLQTHTPPHTGLWGCFLKFTASQALPKRKGMLGPMELWCLLGSGLL